MRLERRVWRALAAAGVILVAWAALLVRLADVPPGVQHDQVFNIVDAIELLYGRYRIYFTANYGREPLFIYTAAAMFKLANGHFIWGLRLASVMWATLGTAVSISVARRKLPAPAAGEAAALVAVLLMVGSFWFLFTGRVGLRAISALTLSAAMIYWLDRALARRSLTAFLVSGLFGGLAIYTYLSARALLALAPLLLVYEGVAWVVRRGRPRITTTNKRMPGPQEERPLTRPFVYSWRVFVVGRVPVSWGLLLSWLTTLAVSAPLLLWLGANPGAERRVGELAGPLVQAMKGQLQPLWRAVEEGVATLLWREPDWLLPQYNLPGRPALPPVLAVLFVIGLAVGLTQVFKSRRERLWLTALALGAGPALITPGGPLYLRAIIALPLIYVYVGEGLWAIVHLGKRALSSRTSSGSARRAAGAVAAIALAALVAAHWAEAANAYFVRWPSDQRTQLIYNADLRDAAGYSAQAPDGEALYISTDFWLDLDQQTYWLYEPGRADVGWYYGPDGLPLPPAGGAATYVWTASAGNRSAALAPLREVMQTQGRNLQVARVDARALDALLASKGVQMIATPLQYGDTLHLLAAGSVPVGDGVELVTRWQVMQPWQQDLPPIASAKLVDATGYNWSQSDDPFAVAYQGWQPGQQFVQVTHLKLPGDMPPGTYQAVVAVYDEKNGALPVSASGRRLAAIPPAANVTVSTDAGKGPVPTAPAQLAQPGENTGLALAGAWDPPSELLAGAPSAVRASWQARKALPTAEVRFRIRAVASETGGELWSEDAPPLQPLPETWPAGQTWRLTHTLHPQAPSLGTTAAQVELCASVAAVEQGCVVIARPQVVNRQVLLALPRAPQLASGAQFGDARSGGEFVLEGYDVAREGMELILTLYWRTSMPPSATLQRFVHGVDGGGQIVAQSDVVPENSGAPPPTWHDGEYVIDRVKLVDETDRIEQFFAGWYDPATGDRLPVRTSDGAIQPDGRLAIPLPVALGLGPSPERS